MVTTTTIAGHRDMSFTGCPGDMLYPIVRNQLPAAVTQERQRLAAAAATGGEPYDRAVRVTPPSRVPHRRDRSGPGDRPPLA